MKSNNKNIKSKSYFINQRKQIGYKRKKGLKVQKLLQRKKKYIKNCQKRNPRMKTIKSKTD